MKKQRKNKVEILLSGMVLAAFLSSCGNNPYENRPEIPPERIYEEEETQETQETQSTQESIEEAEKQQEEKNQLAKEQLENLQEKLSATDNQVEVMELLAEENWLSAFLPEQGQKRNYFVLKNELGEVTLLAEIGYTKSQETFSRIWYLYGENHVQYLERTPQAFRIADTMLVDEKYDGNFEIWLCTASEPKIFHEKGTFEKGICVGDYSVQLFQTEETMGLMDLWNKKENLNLKEFTGSFQKSGIVETKQQNTEAKEIVLAYDKRKKEYLAVSTEQKAEEMIFSNIVVGIKDYPNLSEGESEETEVEEMDCYSNRVIGKAKQQSTKSSSQKPKPNANQTTENTNPSQSSPAENNPNPPQEGEPVHNPQTPEEPDNQEEPNENNPPDVSGN